MERIFPATRYDKIPSYADFDGVADKIDVPFIAPRCAGAIRRCGATNLAVAPNGDLGSFLIERSGSRPKTPPENLVLLHNVQGLDIAYFGVAPPDNRPAWRFAWEQRPSPPQLIRIRVHFAPQDPRVWPELLIKPVATVDSMCVLMIRTGKCRGRA